jgi:AraC-like DNA-binding protein
MLLEPTNLASLAAVMERMLRSYGLDSRPLLREAGIDIESLEVPGARVPLARMVRLWELTLEATGDPCVGLATGRLARPAHFHGLGLAWISSRTIGGALRRVVRYHRVLSTAIDVRLVEEGPESILTLDHPAEVRLPAEGVDAFFSATVCMCREMANGDFSPLRVELERDDPGRPDAYAEIFRSPVAFSQARDALVLDREKLDRTVPGGNEALAAEAAAIAERYLADIESSPTVAKVRTALLELLPTGLAGQEEVARRINTSVSTLQRSLRAEGTSYREVVEQTRKTLALRHVRDNKYPLAEVAFLVGFADQASFSKAFRRWTGSPPGKYREATA